MTDPAEEGYAITAGYVTEAIEIRGEYRETAETDEHLAERRKVYSKNGEVGKRLPWPVRTKKDGLDIVVTKA